MPGQRLVEIVLRADDKASAVIGRVAGALRGPLVAAGSIAAGGLGALTAEIVLATRAAIESEKQQVRLANAIRAAGQPVPETVEKLSAIHQQLQRLTGIDDDVIAGIDSILISIGHLGGEDLERTRQAVLDFATQTGTEFDAAAKLFAKAAAGNTAALSRYGLVVDETIPKNERFAALLKLVKDNMGGAAEAAGATFQGRLKALSGAFENLQETIGSFVTRSPQLRELIESAIDLMEDLNKSLEDGRADWAAWVKDGVLNATDAFGVLAKSIGVADAFLRTFSIGLSNLMSLAVTIIKPFLELELALAKVALQLPGGSELMKGYAFNVGAAAVALETAKLASEGFAGQIDAQERALADSLESQRALQEALAGLRKRLADLGADSGSVADQVGRTGKAMQDAGEDAEEMSKALKAIEAQSLEAQLKELTAEIEAFDKLVAEGRHFAVDVVLDVEALRARRAEIQAQLSGAVEPIRVPVVPFAPEPDVSKLLDVPEEIRVPFRLVSVDPLETDEQRDATGRLTEMLEEQRRALEGVGQPATAFGDALERVRVIQEELAELGLPLTERMQALSDELTSLAAATDASTESFEAQKEAADLVAGSIAGNFTSAFDAIIFGGQNAGRALATFFRSLLRDLSLAIIRLTIFRGLMRALGFAAFAGGGVVSGGGGAAGGGSSAQFQHGGVVPGTGDRDTVPALLTPGEIVVPAHAARAIRSGRAVLSAIRSAPPARVSPLFSGLGLAPAADGSVLARRGIGAGAPPTVNVVVRQEAPRSTGPSSTFSATLNFASDQRRKAEDLLDEINTLVERRGYVLTATRLREDVR